MASMWERVKSLVTFKQTDVDRILSDKAKEDSKPKKVDTKVHRAGLVYNTNNNFMSGSQSRDKFYRPLEYDMSVIANALDTESYFRRAVEKYVELIWKNGYEFVGKNKRATEYIRARFSQIAMVTRTPTEELFRQITYQIVTYANAFVSKRRNRNASGGRVRITFDGKELQPVAGYFVEDTTSIKVSTDEHGEVKGYKQTIRNNPNSVEWNPHNMIHMYYSRKPGLFTGTPMVVPVLDDIRALRKLEQNVELLVFQHTIPLYQYKVGSDVNPGQPDEIDAVKAQVERMPPNGAVVTSERHEITAVGVDDAVIDVSKYLTYFKSRVLAGLGMSPVTMGESQTANKSTAASVHQDIVATTEMFQNVIRMCIDEFMIRELLAEGGYIVDGTNTNNMVSIHFYPIDQEAEQAKENHVVQMYAQHLISESEARIEIGRDPITNKDRADMFFAHIAMPLAIIGASDEAFTAGAKKAQAAKATGAAKNQPSNQFGKLPAKPTIRKRDIAEIIEILSNLHNKSEEIIEKDVKIKKNEDFIDEIVLILRDIEQDTMKSYLDSLSDNEYAVSAATKTKKYIFDISKNMISNKIMGSSFAKREYLNSRFEDILNSLWNKVSLVFEVKDQVQGITKIKTNFDISIDYFLVCYDNLEDKVVTPEEAHSNN